MANETRSRLPRAGVADGVVGWRRDQLRAAGFPGGLAEVIAGDWRFDLHALIELVERGCPPPLAARILAPLDPPAARAAAGRAEDRRA
jgi:hypothetical protein